MSEKLRPYHFDGIEKELFVLLTHGAERFPKLGKDLNKLKDSEGNDILETRYTPTTMNIIDSRYAGNEYFKFLTSLEPISLKELNHHVNNHLKSVKAKNLRKIYNNALMRLIDDEDMDEVNAEFDELRLELERSYSNQKITATMAEGYDELVRQTREKNFLGEYKQETGFKSLDYMLGGGIHPGDLFVLASKTGEGKSMFTMQVVVNLAAAGNRVGVLSLEMSEAENIKRIWTHLVAVEKGLNPFYDIDNNFYQSNFESAFEKMDTQEKYKKRWTKNGEKILKDLPIVFMKPKDITIPELKKYCNFLYEREKCDVILLDHILLINAPKLEERIIVKEVANFMKLFADEKKIIAMAVSQMNRGIRKDSIGDINNVDALSGGRSIEQAASQIVTISRLPPSKNASESHDNFRKISLIKSRHSKDNQYFYCDFRGNSSTFMEIQPDNWSQIKTNGTRHIDLDYSSFELDYGIE